MKSKLHLIVLLFIIIPLRGQLMPDKIFGEKGVTPTGSLKHFSIQKNRSLVNKVAGDECPRYLLNSVERISLDPNKIGSYRIENDYNENEELIREISYVRNNTDTNWIPYIKRELSYNNGKVTNTYYSGWNTNTSQYVPIARWDFFYTDNDSEIVDRIITYDWDDIYLNNYEENERRDFFYEQGQLIQEVYYIWGSVTQEWNFQNRIRYEYNQDELLIRATTEIFPNNANSYEPNTKIEYTYDSNNLLIKEENFLYTNQWGLTNYYNYFYDSSSRKIRDEYTDLVLTNEGLQYVLLVKKYYYYDTNGNLSREQYTLLENGAFNIIYNNNYNYQVINCATTAIPDANFEQALIDQGIDSDGIVNGQVFNVDIENIPDLDLGAKNISNLTGIEGFTSLVNLDIGNNLISTIDLSSNILLEVLDCGFNNLNELDISKNVSVQKLWCGSNGINDLDVSNNPDLIWLICYNNNLDNLNLDQNINLEVLYAASNNLTSLDLNNNVNLISLELRENQLSNLYIKNGNNTAMPGYEFSTVFNPNLLCIEVDDPTWSNANWTIIDNQTGFSEDCGSALPDNFATEFLSLDDNQVPDGWTFEAIRSADINNGKMNAYINDGVARLTKEALVSEETTEIVLEMDAAINYSFWGLIYNFQIYSGDNYLSFNTGEEDYEYPANTLSNIISFYDGTNGSLEHESQSPSVVGTYHLKLIMNDSGYRFIGIDQNGVESFNIFLEDTGYFDFKTIDRIQCNISAHTDNDGWIDNLQITVNDVSINDDDDDDGVPNDVDLCPNSNPGVEVDLNGCEIQTPIFGEVYLAELGYEDACFYSDFSSDGGSVILDKGFLYGPTSAVENAINAGSGIDSYIQCISGLTPDTVYFFRAFATNESGTAYSAISLFRTPIETNLPPSISETAFALDENSGIETEVGVVTATDPNGDILTFSIVSGNESGAFQIDGSSGMLIVANSTPLDYESTPVFNLVIRASDGSFWDDSNVTINLNDLQENQPTDSDNDGVPDDLDQCPNTNPGQSVNENGCMVFSYDAFTLYTESTACPGIANGQMDISASVETNAYVFDIQVEGSGVDINYENLLSYNNTVSISDLASGTYVVTISSENGFYFLFDQVVIAETGDLTVDKQGVNVNSKTAMFKVSGNLNYSVSVNQKVYSFKVDTKFESAITVPLEKGENSITIKGADCQSVFKDQIVLPGIVLYPNPVSNGFYISGNYIGKAALFANSGNLIKEVDVETGIYVDIQELPAGVYFLHLKNGNKEILKIIKQ